MRAVTLRHRDSGDEVTVAAAYVLDATETGELLPLTGTEYVTGFESRPTPASRARPATAQPDNMQAVSVCFAVDHVDGDHTIDKPAHYDFWRAYQPPFWGGPLLGFRRRNPRTLEIAERPSRPNPDDDRCWSTPTSAQSRGDSNLWTFRRIAARRNFCRAPTPATSAWSTGR